MVFVVGIRGRFFFPLVATSLRPPTYHLDFSTFDMAEISSWRNCSTKRVSSIVSVRNVVAYAVFLVEARAGRRPTQSILMAFLLLPAFQCQAQDGLIRLKGRSFFFQAL